MIKFIKDTIVKDQELGRNEQERTLLKLDQKIEILKNLYQLYFNGELKLPPEKERDALEKEILKVSRSESRSPRLSMMMQNTTSKFSLYNNIWLKKMNAIETGEVIIPSRPRFSAGRTAAKAAVPKGGQVVSLNLNDEGSFEKFAQAYQELNPDRKMSDGDREELINAMKTKMIMNNIVTSDVEISVKKGETDFRIKD